MDVYFIHGAFTNVYMICMCIYVCINQENGAQCTWLLYCHGLVGQGRLTMTAAPEGRDECDVLLVL